MNPAMALLLSLSTSAAEDAQTTRIPFQFVANQVRLEATLNGSSPLHLILDTGMPIPGVLLFENERVRALKLADSGARVRVAGAGQAGKGSDALLADGVALALGPLSVPGTRALVIPQPEGFPPGVDGVIGGELFFRYVVRIDMDQKVLVLSKPEGWSPTAGVCSIPLVREGGSVFVDLRVAVGSEEPVPARVVVDIGAGHALSLNGQAGAGFAAPAGAVDMPLGRGVSGPVLGKNGRVRRVELGEFAFESVVVGFPVEEQQRPGGADHHDGNLGEGILKRFNLTFDYAGKRLLLEKAQGFAEPFEVEMSGLALDWQPDATLLVRGVLPRSPAAAAEIREGDRLLAIDGRPTSALGEDGLRKALLAEGKELRLSIRRGDERIEKLVRLKRIV
jgi:hypothetical protein